MPINDAQRFNERTERARAIGEAALAAALAILRALRARDLLSAEDEAAIVDEVASATGPSFSEAARLHITDRLRQKLRQKGDSDRD